MKLNEIKFEKSLIYFDEDLFNISIKTDFFVK